jgi:16S rRNA (uracil1498-N3)-methyltransferase
MSERFYVNLPLTAGPFTLDGVEAHHLATVCRLRQGDAVCLFNGDGREYPARIIKAARGEIALEILGIEEPQRELPWLLEVAAPLPKGDRSQFLIEKLAELGVTTFVPLLCQRSNTHPREAKREKLERHVIEASKQCGRNVLMKIADLTRWADYAIRGDAEEMRILAHPHQAEDLAALPKPHGLARIAVGPEGGFTDEEIALALKHGWRAVSLGPRILRIETAAVVLATLAGT